ncbi:Resolvase [Gaiella occulta]|uniref:Resolvase n=1 Tax=Gaiella occulta TaxID=1002870 RepID=A0A7M2YWN5_9ACTN|nr:recombinase family protein [Gaiella occulta]RDI74486.1 Resolvase [Gaiella occulta]
MIRAGIYARISSDREGDNLAIGRQLADCEELAGKRGWEVVERYVDSDLSAWSGKVRPEYRRLLEEIEARLIDAVVVYHADRLHRHPKELEEFIDLCQRTETKLATVSGDLDLSTHEGQLMARITGAVAKKSSDDMSRRIRRKHQDIALAGRPSGGGTRPFGYESDHRTARPAEAAVIRECAARALAGDSLRSICIDLNDREVGTVQGKRWSPQTLRRMLMSARISGQREHHGEIVAAGDWDAIITPVETHRLRAKLGDPDRRTNRSARRYLLARLLRCGHCEMKLLARPRDDGSRRYVCASGPSGGCGKTTIVADALELFIVDAVLHRLDSPELAAALNGRQDDPEGAGWQAEIEQAQEQLDELAAMWGSNEISRSEWLKARATIQQRQDTARKRLAALNRTSVLSEHLGNAVGLRERWAGLTLTRQQQIVAAVLDHVVVGPGRRGFNKFDPARLDPVWRA